jgi:hypothetical protein
MQQEQLPVVLAFQTEASPLQSEWQGLEEAEAELQLELRTETKALEKLNVIKRESRASSTQRSKMPSAPMSLSERLRAFGVTEEEMSEPMLA